MNAHEVLKVADEMVGFGRTPDDSCVAHDAGHPVKKALACVNCEIGDLLLAQKLGCDTVLVHHPLAGSARRNFHRVLGRMVELMTEHGVSGERVIQATDRLREKCRFSDQASDWDHLVSGARLLGLNLLNAHLAPDELGRRAMVDAVAGIEGHEPVSAVADRLRTIPELAHDANTFIEVPDDPMRQCGRVAVMHAGGTNGGADVAEALFEAGVGTVVYIHLSGDDAIRLRQRAEAGGLGGVLVTGHFASDAIGLNLYLAELEKRGVELVRHGGLGTFAPA